LLFQAILDKLYEPRYLDSSQRSFLYQTFGLDNTDDILEFFSSGSQDVMTFLDWLFFPDITFQRHIESILSGKSLSKTTHSALIDQLCSAKITSTIQISSQQNLTIVIEPELISTFVFRLALHRFIPDQFHQISFKNDFQKHSIFVYLRNQALSWTDERADFICQIIRKFMDRPEQLFDILPQMLIFCGHHQSNFLRALEKKKQQLVQNLHRFQNLQALQEKHSMEFLISSGVRSIHVDVSNTENEIEMINNILCDSFIL